MKNIEERDPMIVNQEEIDEEQRLYGKDKAHDFVTSEQVPDESAQEKIENFDGIDSSETLYTEEQKQARFEEGLRFESPYTEEMESGTEKDSKRIKELQKEIKFAHYEGSASVGPDVEEQHVINPEEDEKELLPKISKRKTNWKESIKNFFLR
ncbi:MAG: hypothetical protein WCQ32_00975 [bacterium]